MSFVNSHLRKPRRAFAWYLFNFRARRGKCNHAWRSCKRETYCDVSVVIKCYGYTWVQLTWGTGSYGCCEGWRGQGLCGAMATRYECSRGFSPADKGKIVQIGIKAPNLALKKRLLSAAILNFKMAAMRPTPKRFFAVTLVLLQIQT
jgi:hypothetical protein